MFLFSFFLQISICRLPLGPWVKLKRSKKPSKKLKQGLRWPWTLLSLSNKLFVPGVSWHKAQHFEWTCLPSPARCNQCHQRVLAGLQWLCPTCHWWGNWNNFSCSIFSGNFLLQILRKRQWRLLRVDHAPLTSCLGKFLMMLEGLNTLNKTCFCWSSWQ